MNIGIFGGSFNPIHIGHCIVANFIVQHSDLEEVWLNVSPQNPLKGIISKDLDTHRVKMTQLAIEDSPKLKVCTVEFDLPTPSYTISTLQFLKENYPQHQFRLIIGSDNWLVFDKWKDANKIISEFGVIVYPRPGYPILNTPIPGNVNVVEAPQIEISSTFIRNGIKSGDDMQFILPDKVRNYVLSNNLYK